MMAPITPFLSDYLWGVLRPADAPGVGAPRVVADVGPALIDPSLSAQMALARRLVELGRSARSAASVRTRQPLSRALVGARRASPRCPPSCATSIADELNVHAVEPLDAAGGELVTYTVKPEFRALGKRFGSSTQAVAAAIRAADPAALAHAVAAAGRRRRPCEVPELGPVTLTAATSSVTQTPLEGWGVATAAGETVALDLAVSDALRAEGCAREVVRLIQDARKSDGLAGQRPDRVRWATSDGDLAAALAAHGELIAGRGAGGLLRPRRGTGRRGQARGTSTPTTTWACASSWPSRLRPPGRTRPDHVAAGGAESHRSVRETAWLAILAGPSRSAGARRLALVAASPRAGRRRRACSWPPWPRATDFLAMSPRP